MKVLLSTLFLFLSFLHAQVSISDINKVANSQLDEIRNELQSGLNEVKNESNDVISNPVVITNDDVELVENEYFGYNYFKSEINFFDNVPTPSDFRLGAGDEIIISLWGETNSREKFIINKEGLIYYENIGFINLSNKTLEEAENLLVNELSSIYSTLNDNENSSQLMVELGKLKSLNIYFSGEISKPGIQLVHPFSDIFVAIIQAGGVSKEGSLRNIKVIRSGNIISTIDFYKFFNEGLGSFSDLRLIDGDTIHIPAIKNRVKIEGAVLRPGFYELLPSDNLNNLINYAAGLEATASSILTVDTIVPLENRKSQDNIVSSININLNNQEQISLNNGDKIIVREIGPSDSKVEIFGRVKVPGEYSALNMSLKDLLDFSGGFDDPVYRKTINDDIVILRLDENQYYGKEFNINYKDAHLFDLEINDKIFVYESSNYSNSFSYTIEGEVALPGTYPLKDGLTLNEAIQFAGGVTEIGSINSVSVTKKLTTLDINGNNINEIERVSNIDLDFQITDNNTITILPKTNVIKVTGNVYNPGFIAHQSGKGMSLTNAVELAGGYKPNSIKKASYVVRANGEIEQVNIFNGRAKRIFPGDAIFVPVDPNPNEFDITSFVADLSSTLANIAAILVIADNN